MNDDSDEDCTCGGSCEQLNLDDLNIIYNALKRLGAEEVSKKEDKSEEMEVKIPCCPLLYKMKRSASRSLIFTIHDRLLPPSRVSRRMLRTELNNYGADEQMECKTKLKRIV